MGCLHIKNLQLVMYVLYVDDAEIVAIDAYVDIFPVLAVAFVEVNLIKTPKNCIYIIVRCGFFMHCLVKF